MHDQKKLAAALTGRYEIQREVGQGGMAIVYQARDIRHDRTVALKVLRHELTSAMGVDRFPREIQIVAQMQHPHILPLHDSGEADGFLYYVMPFVDGETLRARLARAEARIGELGALRARFDAQQGLLRQQLIALRDLAPSGADVSEITGRIRAVNADLRALAEGLGET